ncbi:hypothetical protein JTB14_033031 [Gonioctena quinquepunctata]|nr:hypothetical protein JTB14_033031 [Gonioctena quinquepunctata]
MYQCDTNDREEPFLVCDSLGHKRRFPTDITELCSRKETPWNMSKLILYRKKCLPQKFQRRYYGALFQEKDTMEYVQANTLSKEMFATKVSETKLIKSATRTAPHNSNRGIDRDFVGATLDFAQMRKT